MKLREAIDKAIELSTKVSEYYERENPKHHRDYPLVWPDETPPNPPPAEQELRDFLLRLGPELISQITLIKDLAAGSVRLEDLRTAYDSLFQSLSSGRKIYESHVLVKLDPLVLGEWLLFGLERLGAQNIEISQQPFPPLQIPVRS